MRRARESARPGVCTSALLAARGICATPNSSSSDLSLRGAVSTVASYISGRSVLRCEGRRHRRDATAEAKRGRKTHSSLAMISSGALSCLLTRATFSSDSFFTGDPTMRARLLK